MSPLPVRPSKSPIHCSTQFSRLCLRHTLLNSQAPPSSTCYRARLSSPPGPTASVTFHVSMHTLVSHSDTSFRDPRSLIFLPLPFATVLSLLTFCPRHLHPLSRPAQSPRPAVPPSSSSPLLAVTSLARCSDLSHPLCPFHRVDVPSRALCANTLIGPSFQSPFPSPLALLRCLKLRDTMLAIHSQPTDSNHLPSPTPSPHRSRCLVGYIHLLAVCLVLGPFPPSLTVWTLMPPSAPPMGSSAHPSPLCPALHLPSPPVILTRGCMTPKAGLSAASLRNVFVFSFCMFLGLFLFGAERCSPSDVLIGLPWGPCPSPPAGENHPPHPGEESLLWRASLPPWAALSPCKLLKDPSSAALTLARHCPPGTPSFPSTLAS